jgi:hypothetical protein
VSHKAFHIHDTLNSLYKNYLLSSDITATRTINAVTAPTMSTRDISVQCWRIFLGVGEELFVEGQSTERL